MDENLDTNPTVKPEQSDYSQSERNAAPQYDKGPPKKTMKRKKDTKNSAQNVNENVSNHTFANEAIEQPKKKKKKKHTRNDSYEEEEKQSVQSNSSGHKKINATEELQPIKNTIMKEKIVMETKDILNNSEASETASPKKKKKKKKGNKQSSSDLTQKNKIMKKAATHENSFFLGISDSRLAAYGENPKKIKNKVKYGKQEF